MTISDFCQSQYKDLDCNDILICALGYEKRSYYLLERNIQTRNNFNTLIIYFDDFDNKRLPSNLSSAIRSLMIPNETCSYDQGKKFQNVLLTYIKGIVESLDDTSLGTIYIDYSSMPRNWYCRLPFMFESALKNYFLELVFIYVAGIYPEEYESYPTAGIDCLKLFSGGVLPKIDSQRTHLIALSYDTIRTQSLLSILEPEFLVVCYAYDTLEKKAEIENVNRDIIRRASASVALPLDDFPHIIQTLNEIILEQTRNGQVVVIPDGPKPLIFAMSISSILAENDEITCLHINRNQHLDDNKVEVSALENEIYCVKIALNCLENE